MSITNASSVDDLAGPGYQIGGSGGAGFAVGGDLMMIPKKESDTPYFGVSASAGLGAGAEGHVIWGETMSSPVMFNMFDTLEQIFEVMYQW